MIKGKLGHSLVVAGNKLFAIKTTPDTHEVFDNTLYNFAMLKFPLIETFVYKVVSIGNIILMFEPVAQRGTFVRGCAKFTHFKKKSPNLKILF